MMRGMERTTLAPPPPTSKVSLHWVVRTFLTASLVLALLEYYLHSQLGQLIHIALFVAAGLLVLCGRRRKERLQHLFGSGVLLMAAVLFGEAISYIAHDFYSVSYGLIFIVILCAARLIVQEIGAPGVMRAYSQAGLITLSFLLTFDFRRVLAGTSVRFSGSTGVHPDLIGFLLAGFLPSILWRMVEYKDRRYQRISGFLAIMAFVIIFLTGSRGSLVAVLAAGGFVLMRAVVFERLLSRVRLSHALIIGILLAVPLIAFYLVQHGRGGQFVDFVTDSLQINSSQRGLKSGLSGRTGIWKIAFFIMRTENRWLVGFGYRAGDRLVGTIDNGYVQLLFESGLIAGSIILGSMLRVLFLAWRASGSAANAAWKRYYTVLWSTMVVYFLNNVSTRYLFSFGSSFSLVVLCLTMSTRRELLGSMQRRPAPSPARRPFMPPDGSEPGFGLRPGLGSGPGADPGRLAWDRPAPF